jgi:superfamily II DNA or RNA helicase
MNLSAELALVEKALDALERREVRVLVWGLVDGALSDGEVDDALNEVLSADSSLSILEDPECSILTADDLRKRLIDFALLMQIPTKVGGSARFRTRMAEGVRLFARLRQLFPGKHVGRDGWIAARTLVADYRLLWRPRRYPKRDLTTAAALEQIGQSVEAPELLSAVRHWFDKGAPTWKWSKFQIDASSRVLGGLEQGALRGTIVSAGTGSGKTLAFYLPALSWLAAQKKTNLQGRGVRIIALYPRNELLKDQLAEVFEQSRKFDDYLGRAGAGSISVGVLFGDTPTKVANAARDWSESGGACPFFRCPSCRGEMRLEGHDGPEIDARLRCRTCGEMVDGKQLRLSRKAMQDDPPDILFTSVEMLNQRLSDSDMRHLFGVGPRANLAPPLMLLDEVHVYSGTYGAQVAHLLRRWSHLTKRRTSFVGLSATIAEGRSFFASLVSMDPAVVDEIAPGLDDLTEEGAEYLLALRGDPVSQASLLSTSIQALMLASRLMDRRDEFHTKWRPFAGWRAFAFTDQVDATNRLFYDLRDAEGFSPRGMPAVNKHPNGGLSHLRAPGPSLRRYEGGQDWRVTTKVGHDLATRHHVERTTAYDSGVDHNAQIVVATAALEVGYDDPAVGVVVQHKAPRDMAQFLQRKGRAGRTRHMRPWTIMVLSDYGRDRLAYQAYEQFFDPELPPRDLPLSNRYIRRMQAVYGLIDYLGVQMQAGVPGGSVWRDLSGPQAFPVFDKWPDSVKSALKELVADKKFPLTPEAWKSLKGKAFAASPASSGAARWQGANRIQSILRRRRLVELLRALMDDQEKGEAFAAFLGSALNLAREEIDPLLWEHPRPLLLGAVPTAWRRLASDWSAHGVAHADRAAGGPLPEFVPATLFSDLSLPEVGLLPLGAERAVAYLPVLQALGEFAPGKVSRRLDAPLWLGPTQDELIEMLDRDPVEELVDIEAWFALDPQPPFAHVEDDKVTFSVAYRPLELLLRPTPPHAPGNRPEVLDKSNARMIWRSQIFGQRAGVVFEPPAERVGIARLVSSVTVHTHASQSQATVRRYAIASKADLRLRRGNLRVGYTATWQFRHHGQPCGVGFEIEVDALCFKLRLPASSVQDLWNSDAEVQRAARTARFAWEAEHGEALSKTESNTFIRGWLGQIFQVAAVQLAEEQSCTLAEAIDELGRGNQSDRLAAVLTTIFQSPEAGESEAGEVEAPVDEDAEPRLKKHLREAMERADVVAALCQLARRSLTDPFDDLWNPWLTQATAQTLGAALLEAIQHACPQVNAEELVVDTDPGPRDSGALPDGPELWISESNPGGNGLIEQIVGVLAADATQFYRRIEAALGPSEFEVIDAQLRDFQQWIGSSARDEEVEAFANAVRNAESSREAYDHLARLRRKLIERGQVVFHGYVTALSTRMLRPGTPPELDRLLAELLARWDALEAQMGIEVDVRVVCALFSADERIDLAFQAAGFDVPLNNRETWRFSLLTGVIWARGHVLRSTALPLAARFRDVPAVSERLLLRAWLSPSEVAICMSEGDWLAQVHARLTGQGRATIAVVGGDSALLQQAMSSLVTVPVQLEYLNVYPRLVSISRHQDETHLHLDLEAAA